MMKTPLLPNPPTAIATPPRRQRRRRRAFSLVEVTLALGIVTFGLVGVVGVLPTALASGRQSFDQNRAAAIANTIFASLRSQPFNKVCYVDEQLQSDGNTPLASGGRVPTLNLDSTIQSSIQVDTQTPVSSSTVQFYASFLDVVSDTAANDAYGSQRRLFFTTTRPAAGRSYLVTLTFNNAPDGMAVQPPADNQASTPPAQANQVNLVVSPASQVNTSASPAPAGTADASKDQYRFVSTVARRSI